jgi:predicted ester cyclase
MTNDELSKFAADYAKAWSSGDPEAVVAFYAKNASISVNDGAPALIAEVAQAFMRDFPDMIVTFDKLEPRPDGAAFHWTLIGTNTGPSGTGRKVRISGYELWKIDDEGLIAESEGHFDSADYARQLGHSAD